MDEATARELYHGKEGLNCAQAVLKAFQPATGMPDSEIASFSNAGGGRAEGGICGALYAAQHLLPDPALSRQIELLFQADATSTLCKKIRKEGKLPCKECVALAAGFVKSHLGRLEKRKG